MILYEFLKFLAKIGVNIFFRRIIVRGKENLVNKGPAILAVNHPNTLMDILLAATLVKQRVGFLGNASLFNNPFVGKLLAYLHTIPVYRRQDVKKGEKLDNRESFRQSIDYLEKDGTIMIFPEGSSFSEMKLRRLKTGLARIALDFGDQTNFEKDLKIVPIGLTYSDPLIFRSEVIMNIGEPISLKKFEAIYKQDHRQAVNQINVQLRQQFEEQLVILNDKPQEQLFKSLLVVIPENTRIKADFPYQYALAGKLRTLKKEYEERYKQLEEAHQKFEEEKQNLKLSNESLENKGKQILYSSLLLRLIGMLFLFPIFTFGWLVNIVPYALLAKLPRRITNEIEYWASIKLISGVFLYPLWHLGLTFGFALGLSLNIWQIGLLFLSLPLSGFFALNYWEQWKKLEAVFRLKNVQKHQADSFLKLSNSKEQMHELVGGVLPNPPNSQI